MTSNIVGSTSTSGKPGKEQLILSSGESDTERSPGLKGIFAEPEGVYRHTRTRTGVITPVDYRNLVDEDESDDEYSAIAESQSSSSEVASHVFANMVGTPEEVAKRFEDQAQIQTMQQDMLRAQQESIDDLKNMVALLLKKKKKSTESPVKTKTSSKSEGPSTTPPKGKGNELEHASDDETHDEEVIQSSSESEKDSNHEEDPNAKRMKELKIRLEAIAHRDELKDVGVVRPYPVEWDDTPYPPKFKAPSLHTFDGKGSPN